MDRLQTREAADKKDQQAALFVALGREETDSLLGSQLLKKKADCWVSTRRRDLSWAFWRGSTPTGGRMGAESPKMGPRDRSHPRITVGVKSMLTGLRDGARGARGRASPQLPASHHPSVPPSCAQMQEARFCVFCCCCVSFFFFLINNLPSTPGKH